MPLIVPYTDHSFKNLPATTVTTCPLCSGNLVYLRDGFRCTRCAYNYCEGCEGGMADHGDSGNPE